MARHEPARRRRHDRGRRAGDATRRCQRAFENPGLPAHDHRHGGHRPKAAKRAERQVATLFGLSTLGTLLFIVAYFAVKPTRPCRSSTCSAARGCQTLLLGLGLGLALFCIGAGAIHWAKTLMPDEEIVEDRHAHARRDEDRDAAVASAQGGRARAPASGGAR